jgi:hypothetical protein
LPSIARKIRPNPNTFLGWIFSVFFGGGRSLPIFRSISLVVCFLLAAVSDLPARALGHVAAEEQDEAAEHRADAEAEAPADIEADKPAGQQQQRSGGANRGTSPVATVDDQVDAAAKASGDQLVDGGVDRRIFTADAEAGDAVETGEAPEVPGEGGEQHADHVDAER